MQGRIRGREVRGFDPSLPSKIFPTRKNITKMNINKIVDVFKSFSCPPPPKTELLCNFSRKNPGYDPD